MFRIRLYLIVKTLIKTYVLPLDPGSLFVGNQAEPQSRPTFVCLKNQKIRSVVLEHNRKHNKYDQTQKNAKLFELCKKTDAIRGRPAPAVVCGGGASQAWLARTVSGLFTTTTTEGLRWKTTTPWIGCGPGHEVVLISIVDASPKST